MHGDVSGQADEAPGETDPGTRAEVPGAAPAGPHNGHEAAHDEPHAAGHGAAGGLSHHERMVADLKRRFIVCLALTVPIIILTPMTRHWLGLEALQFAGDGYVLLALSAFVYGWGGWPFLSGAYHELSRRRPAMMTLVAVAITAAFVYSTAVVL